MEAPSTPVCLSEGPGASSTGSAPSSDAGDGTGSAPSAAAAAAAASASTQPAASSSFALVGSIVHIKGPIGKARVLSGPKEAGGPFAGQCLVEQVDGGGRPTGLRRHVYPRLLRALKEVGVRLLLYIYIYEPSVALTSRLTNSS
jgi:hypothetical protein